MQVLQFIPGLDKHGDGSAHVGVRFLSGGLSGITASTMTYPLDLVRTRLAAQVNSLVTAFGSHYLICLSITCCLFENINIKLVTLTS